MDVVVMTAVLDLQHYGDPEPLAKLVEAGNLSVLSDPDARQIIAKALRGESFKGKGNKRARKIVRRNEQIALALIVLRGAGMAIKNNPLTSKAPCACRTIGKIINKSETAVYSIWKTVADSEAGHSAMQTKEHGKLFIAQGSVDQLTDFVLSLSTSGPTNYLREDVKKDLVGLFAEK